MLSKNRNFFPSFLSLFPLSFPPSLLLPPLCLSTFFLSLFPSPLSPSSSLLRIKELEFETQNKVRRYLLLIEYLHVISLKNQRGFFSHSFREIHPLSSSLGQSAYLPCCPRPALPISFNTKALSKERSVAS